VIADANGAVKPEAGSCDVDLKGKFHHKTVSLHAIGHEERLVVACHATTRNRVALENAVVVELHCSVFHARLEEHEQLVGSYGRAERYANYGKIDVTWEAIHAGHVLRHRRSGVVKDGADPRGEKRCVCEHKADDRRGCR
jgi:hypothetical protein